MATNEIPEGYMRNAAGHLVATDQVREQDKLRDQLVREIADSAAKLNNALRAFKAKSLADVAALVSLSAERYGVTIGGDKGNVELKSFDGRLKINRQVAAVIRFSEEIEAAKALINSCFERWSVGANPHIRALVDRAFRTDSQGQIKTSAILELLRLEIEDEEWKRAMQALRDSIQADGTATYLRVYRRVGETDAWEAISLDLAAV